MPSSTDFVAGLDLTSYASVTGAQLSQLVNSAHPYSDKGLIVVTTDSAGIPQIPDAATTTKWKNYLWLRISPTTTSFSVYAWNPSQTYIIPYTSGSTSYTVTTNWNPISTGAIPAGSIQGYQLAANTVTYDKINTVQISQVTGFTPANYVAKSDSPTAADISGNFTTGLIINNAAVTGTKIVSDGVNGIVAGNINPKAVTAAKVLGGTSGQLLKTTDSSNNAGWVTPNELVSEADANVAKSGKGTYVLRVNSGATAYELVNPSVFQNVLQYVKVTSTAVAKTNYGTTSGLYPYQLVTTGGNGSLCITTSGIPATGTNLQYLSALDASITPLKTGSTLKITVHVPLGANNNSYPVIGLFTSNASLAAPICMSMVNGYGLTNYISNVTLIHHVTAGTAGVAMNFYVGFGCASAGNVYVNSVDGTTKVYGASNSAVALITIEELA